MASTMNNNGSTYDPFAMLTNKGSVKKMQRYPPAPFFNQRQQPRMGNTMNPMAPSTMGINNNGMMGMSGMSGMSSNTGISGMNGMMSGGVMSSMPSSMPMSMKPMNSNGFSNTNRKKKSTTTKHDPFANLAGI